ncbi:MAG: hypothetical protein U0835_26580 [Isosphaeraceae bacterium]
MGAGKSAPAWARHATDVLRDVARQAQECEVLEHELVGRPVRQIGDLITAVGIEAATGTAEANRVTSVVRPGYALRLADGSRLVLARALVRIAP